MKIKLYGLPTCCRCKTAKMMLEKRNITFEYADVNLQTDAELPQLFIDDKVYYGKEALLKIRELNTFTNPTDTNIKQ